MEVKVHLPEDLGLRGRVVPRFVHLPWGLLMNPGLGVISRKLRRAMLSLNLVGRGSCVLLRR